MCLLALIDDAPRYGYEMAQKLQERGFTSISDGTIYPLVSRLQSKGLVDSYFEGSSGGPQRKYYRLTKRGQVQLDGWKREWRSLQQGVDQVLKGGKR